MALVSPYSYEYLYYIYLKKNIYRIINELRNRKKMEGWRSVIRMDCSTYCVVFYTKWEEIEPCSIQYLAESHSTLVESTGVAAPLNGEPGYTGMGVSVRTVQRAINDLEKANLLDKKPTSKSDNRYGGRNIYDLTKLVDYLDIIGPSVSEQVRKPRHKKPIYTVRKKAD